MNYVFEVIIAQMDLGRKLRQSREKEMNVYTKQNKTIIFIFTMHMLYDNGIKITKYL
jgi:hypothetical protein